MTHPPSRPSTAALLRSAVERACPKCDRKAAMVKGKAWVKGVPVRVCRWCRYVEGP